MEIASSDLNQNITIFKKRAVIKFCANIEKSLTETKQMIYMADDGVHFSRSKVFKWHKRFRNGRRL